MTKGKAERDSDNGTNERLPKAKTRKYDEAYAAPVVTVTLWVKVFYVFEEDWVWSTVFEDTALLWCYTQKCCCLNLPVLPPTAIKYQSLKWFWQSGSALEAKLWNSQKGFFYIYFFVWTFKNSKGFIFKAKKTVRHHQLLSISYFSLPEVLKRSPPSRSDLV